MVVVLVVVLDPLYAKKGGAQNHCEDQAHNRGALAADLRAVNRNRHRETADDQDGGVDGAQSYVEVIAGADECRRIFKAIQRVRQEHPPKEHDFRDEKHPHPEGTRLALLLHVLEMMLQRRMRRMIVCCC